MESYITLIYKELEFATPKAQYEYLLELKQKAKQHAQMIGTLRVCANTFKALSETWGLENVKSICESGMQISSQYETPSAGGAVLNSKTLTE